MENALTSADHRAITTLIADHLGSLPHPDGMPRRLMGFSTVGRDEQSAAAIRRSTRDIADALVHLLTTHGWMITR